MSAATPWSRLHAALMPDYNRKATLYWWAVVVLGGIAIAWSARSVSGLSPVLFLQVGIGVAVAMLAGVFPVRIPGSKNSFAAGEIFIFSLLLLHGPAAATLASAGEAMVGALRTSKRWTSRIASPAMAALSMWCAGSLLEAALGGVRSLGWGGAAVLLATVTAFALVYFVINTLLVALVPKLKRNEWLKVSELFGNFGWIGIAYSGSASVATLLFLTFQQTGVGVLVAAVPIIALLLSTMHLFFRQQEADEAIRQGRLEAVEREQEQAQRHVEELQHIAFHDSLTGLPNRRQFHELLGHALTRAADDPERQFGVLFLDFDRFKLINDSLGHSVGDEFLVQISHRIQQHVRPGDVVARLGGDEFAILVEGLGCVDYAVALAERLQQVLRQPVRVGGTEINASASIGITSSAIAYREPGEVLRDADIAMYRAKAAGKARHAMFDVGLRTEISQRLMLEGELRAALAEGALCVEYQPLFNLSTGRLTGFEALARWHHPQLGTISPATFIPIAEESGLIIGLTDFVMQRACAQRAAEALPGRRRPRGGLDDARQHLQQRHRAQGLPRARDPRAGRGAAAAAGPDAGAHREHPDGAPGRCGADADRAARAGRAAQRRRLRHRLLLAEPPGHAALRQPEDRSLVRAGPGPRLERADRRRDRLPGPCAGQVGHRRRHRDGQPVRAAVRDRVRVRPGLPHGAVDDPRACRCADARPVGGAPGVASRTAGGGPGDRRPLSLRDRACRPLR
jgi:diguanylate cyclase (GGDEF)-like protein